jgi:hypothetical protein
VKLGGGHQAQLASTARRRAGVLHSLRSRACLGRPRLHRCLEEDQDRGREMANGWVARHGDRWRARYGHPELGTEHQATFDGKVDAQRWLRLSLPRSTPARGWTRQPGR